MKLPSGFCIPEPLPVHTGIKGRQVHPLIRFLLQSRVDEKSADLHKAVHLCHGAVKTMSMSTMVVQDRHFWLNLAEMKDVDKARFLDAPATPSRALPSSSRRYSSRPRRSSTSCPSVMHHPPLPPGPGLSLTVAVGALLRPPELLRPRLNRHLGRRVKPHAGERRPLHPSQAPSRPESR